MSGRQVPQPALSRMTPFAGHPIVVGVTPGQSPLVAATAASWAIALGVRLYPAYVDPTRITEREFPDGTVQHSGLDPDSDGEQGWQRRRADLDAELHALLDGSGVAWEFRYLAGRVDRALTHLARAVDAAAFVVGAHDGHARGSVAAHLVHHQHRPVLVVPVAVVDWQAPTPWQ